MNLPASKSDILCISTTDWNEIWGSRQQLMQQFVRAGYRVLFVERQIGPEKFFRNPALFRHKMASWKKPLNLVETNLWRWQPPLMPPGRYYSHFLNRIGQQWMAKRLKIILHKLDFQVSVLWMYPPQSSPLLRLFGEKMAVYHCIERFAGEQTGLKHQVMLSQEENLLRNVDQVFVHSDRLRELYSPLTRQPIILTPSAADVTHFQSTDKIHPLMDSIPRPRLVVMGSLDERVNWDLLLNLALWKSNWQLILIGQIRYVPTEFHKLLDLSNVHYFGEQPFADLPLFLNGSDVNLIPYKITGMTKYISPIKAYEYLAVGNPIVSVDLPELHSLKEWISIVQSDVNTDKLTKHMIREISHELKSDTPKKRSSRRKTALKHTWQSRALLMQSTIEPFLENANE